MIPQLLTEADLPAARDLLARVELGGGVAAVARYLRWQPDGVWGVFDDGRLAGMVSLLEYGTAGFVGCMGVLPELQGRGLGRLLLEHAQAVARSRGVATFLLEATASGRRLYEKLGYVHEYPSAIMTRPREDLRVVALDMMRDRRDEVLALDREAIGAPRTTMIASLVDEHPGMAVGARGELAGYGLVVGERLGPVIARDPGAGRAIVERLAPATTVLTVPLVNEPSVAAIEAAGFTTFRRIDRMRLGAPVPIRVDRVWTLAASGAG